MTRSLILRNRQSPGDVLVMTAAVRSLHRQHPGEFVTVPETIAQSIWDNNPDCAPRDGVQNPEIIDMHYPLVNQSNGRAVHFMQGYCDFLADTLGVCVPLLVNAPVLVLSEHEKAADPIAALIPGRPKYWIVNAGTKSDFTAKGWGTPNYQAVVSKLCGRILFVQIGESGHLHEKLDGVIDMRGKTDTRQFIHLCWHAQGAIGPSTFLQHIMAALGKPYVCLAGGREPVFWLTYPMQTTLHAIGKLDCCRDGGCWKSRTVKLNDGSSNDHSVCSHPVKVGSSHVPKCLTMFSADDVVRAVESYYFDGTRSY